MSHIFIIIYNIQYIYTKQIKQVDGRKTICFHVKALKTYFFMFNYVTHFMLLISFLSLNNIWNQKVNLIRLSHEKYYVVIFIQNRIMLNALPQSQSSQHYIV